jgi:hypothetical protein
LYTGDHLGALDRGDPTLLAAITDCFHLFNWWLAVEHEQRLDVILVQYIYKPFHVINQ